MKSLFQLVLTILLFIGFMPINSAGAEEYLETEEYSEDFQTTISVPIYEDNNVLVFEEDTENSEDEKNETFAAAKEVAKVNFGVDKTNLISYQVVMNKGYKFKSFSGALVTTDLTSGLSQGRKQLSGKSGSVQIAQLNGHTFRSTLTGTVTTTTGYGSNLAGASIMWIYKK
ncbi:hypothetical protein [Lysinibacillus sp. JNUCC 51]|uniref:hypothetical protein n=1 Tax=Lysinibacillus sp. JNUCC-51 TaxID=2792479 RepID=UPI001936FAC2|nr:hypothetical protein JNUCC51_23525 [Lysinibacillus sp. JNUCC-51]